MSARVRIAAILTAILLPIGALTTAPPPPAHADVEYDKIEVYKSGTCPPHVAPIWFFVSEILGVFAHPLTIFVLGPGALILPYIGAISGLAAFTVCTGTTTIDTMRFLINEIERVSRMTVDETLAARLETYASGLGELILRREELLEAAIRGELSERERNDLAAELTLIGNQASRALEQAAAMDWQSLLVVPVLSAIEVQAYLLAARVSPGSEKARLHLAQLADDSRATLVEIMRAKEDRLRWLLADAELYNDRVKTVGYRQNPDGPGQIQFIRSYRIESFAREGGAEWRAHDVLEVCQTPDEHLPWEHQTFPCEKYDERWQELVAESEQTYRDYRERILGAIPPEYLAAKASAGYYATYGSPGEAEHSFRLVNNQKLRDTTWCVGVADPESVQVGSALETQPCTNDLATPAGRAQVFDYIPNTPILRHVGSGLCVDGEPIPAEEGGEVEVSLVACPTDASMPTQEHHLGEIDSRAWGMHPAGYLVHLATRRCLDPRPDGPPSDSPVYGTGPERILVSTRLESAGCRYEEPSMRNGIDAPKNNLGGSFLNDQVWHVRPAEAAVELEVDAADGFSVSSGSGSLDCRPVATGKCRVEVEVGTELTLTARQGSDAVDPSTTVVDWTGGCADVEGPTCTLVAGVDPAHNRVRVTIGDRPPVDEEPTDPDPDTGTEPTTVSASPVTQVYGRSTPLTVEVSPAMAGTVNVVIGELDIGAPVVEGVARPTIPALALRPGTYDADVRYTGAGPEPTVLTTTTQVDVAKAGVKLTGRVVKVTKGRKPKAVVAVRVRAEGVQPTGSVAVRLGRRPGAVALKPGGTARIRIVVPKARRSVRLVVRYGGDDLVAPGVTRSKVKLKR